MAGPRTLRAFQTLLSYPTEELLEAAELLYIILQTELPEAATEIAKFGAFVEQQPMEQIEEAFSSAFELNPAGALEIGWHLFGEDYDRGMLLVRLRQELRKYGLPESLELPDHLTHVLPLIAAMPDEEAQRFVPACVVPAVDKLQEAFARQDSPYGSVIRALQLVLSSVWGQGRPLPDGSGRYRADGRAIPGGVDLLHAFPAADVHFGCGGGCQGSCGHSDEDAVPTDQPGKLIDDHFSEAPPQLVQLGGLTHPSVETSR